MMPHWELTILEHRTLIKNTRRLNKVMLMIAVSPLTLDTDASQLLKIADEIKRIATTMKERATK